MKKKYVVSEKALLQSLKLKCPLCGSNVKVEKFIRGVLVILSQQCLQCEYRHQWKNQANASFPEPEHKEQTGGVDVTPEIKAVRLKWEISAASFYSIISCNHIVHLRNFWCLNGMHCCLTAGIS